MSADDKEPAMDQERLDGWKLDGLDFPSFRMSLVAKVMDRLTIRELSAITNLPIAEWRVLSRLALAPKGLTVRQIAMKAWVDRAEVSRAATSLEKQGLVGRRDNPADRRAPIMFITPAGEGVYGPLMAHRTAFHARVMQSLTAEESELLDELLRKLAADLLAMTEEAVR
ncbi:MarR family transcriptional regulator [Sphingobium sp. HWE2-09]|uniref:MarR family transcriptional regulator n=1 Tax=Sphingobium sp. HWE2-09 TaxID=3108390 RepID=UPI002DC5625A|nr:MarR family transcriptional regulator [Sphingobium sp. HWE2-09]